MQVNQLWTSRFRHQARLFYTGMVLFLVLTIVWLAVFMLDVLFGAIP